MEWLVPFVILGVFTGILSGMFGMGGAFIITPLLIVLFAVEPSTAIGCALGYTLGIAVLGVRCHRRAGHVEWNAIYTIGGGAAAGAVIGFQIHHWLAYWSGLWFDHLITGAYVLLLLPVAWLLAHQNQSERRGRSARDTGRDNLPWMARLPIPPYVQLRHGHPTSLIALVGSGVILGLVTGTLGIGGGVILVPILILLVGLRPHVAIGTSLGVILIGSAVSVVQYGWFGHINLAIVAALIAGGYFGIKIGTRVCQGLAASELRHAFAVVVLLIAGFIAIQWSYDVMQTVDKAMNILPGEMGPAAVTLTR